jgi:hypothetical protein
MNKLTLLSLAFALTACADSEKEGADSGVSAPEDGSGSGDDGSDDGDDGGGDGGGEGGDAGGDDAGTGDDPCSEEYAFCGSIAVPADLVGTPRAMAISLYDTLSPAGPPNVTVTEIDAPEVVAGEAYPVEFSPLIATGDYYVFVFLYMEGGGEWAPEPGVDYFGHTDAMLSFNGDAVLFDDIDLAMAQ